MAIWGYILDMPGRPSPADQRAALALLGVTLGKRGTLWSDKLDRAKRHRTAGQTQLTGRNDLIRAVMAGDTVVVTNHLCLGVSPQDAGWFLGQMAERDVTVLINGVLVTVDPGDDAGDVLTEFHRLLRNYATAKSRGRS